MYRSRKEGWSLNNLRLSAEVQIIYNRPIMTEEQPNKKGVQPNLTDLITLHEAAELSGLSNSHLRLLARKGTIWATRLGHNWFTTPQAVQDYLSLERRPGPKSLKDSQSTPAKD
jgi:excisionase family DNA binding protein